MASDHAFPGRVSLAIVVASDALNIVSADYDARHLGALCTSTIDFSQTVLLVQNPQAGDWPPNADVRSIDAFGPIFREAFSKVLSDFAAKEPGEPHDVFLAVCADASVGLSSSEFVRTELTRHFDYSARIFVLADMCSSGSYLGLPWHSADGLNFERCRHGGLAKVLNTDGSPALLGISAVGDGQMDSDDISALGFDGGLTAAFVDYVLSKRDTLKTNTNDANLARSALAEPWAALSRMWGMATRIKICPRDFFVAHTAAQRASGLGVASVVSVLHMGDIVAF